MDYVYGQLCERVKQLKSEYRGLETDTAVVTVNNSAETISVSTKLTESTVNNIVSEKLSEIIPPSPVSDGQFMLAVTVTNGNPTYEWKIIEV